MERIVFYILAAAIIVFSIMSVTSKKILRAAVYLLFVLISTSGLYFLFEYNFLAAVQLTVYAGGIMVLIIFSILLTHQVDGVMETAGTKKMIFGALASISGVLLTISVITAYHFNQVDGTNVLKGIKNIGNKLMAYGDGGYILPFEVISVLLLAAMVGAIIIAKRVKTDD